MVALKIKKAKMKMSKNDKIFDIINISVLSFILILVLYPLIYILSSSFSSPQAVISGKVWLLPVEPSLAGYQAVLKYRSVWVGYSNSLFYAFFGTLINIVLTILAAYPLSRKDFFGRNFFMMIFTFTMLFNGGLIPLYMTVKGLGIINTRWAMILPQALQVWYVILARTYFQTSIPSELSEAAELDGCSDLKFLSKVVLPLSAPIIAVLVLFYAVFHWNAYFEAFIYLKSMKLYPLQIFLRNILIQSEVNPKMMANISADVQMQGMRDLIKFALIVVASVPVLAIYPFVQKYFVKGIMVGSLKG
jgi:ABC-type glycerol-3-phosphate transport system permease component